MGRYDVLLENNQPPKPQPATPVAEKATPKPLEPLKSLKPAKQPFEAAPVEPAPELAEPRVHKDTVRISDSEYEAFDELKRDARRRFDLRLSKEEVYRLGMETLTRDYHAHGETSTLVTHYKKRQS